MSVAQVGETPLDDAVYVGGGVDKIFGVIGNHIAKFNASTGALENFARVAGPATGYCRLTYHSTTGLLYVGIWDFKTNQWNDPPTSWVLRGIYPVNPTSLAIGAVIDVMSFASSGSRQWCVGIQSMFSAGGTYLYFCFGVGGINAPTTLWRVNPTNTADNFNPANGASSAGQGGFYQIDTGASNIYCANPYLAEIQRYDLALTDLSYNNSAIPAPYTNVDNPVSVAYASTSGTAYAVCGSSNMFRADFGTNISTRLDLSAVPGATGTVAPQRIRYRSSDSKLYMPVQSQNAIIVWNAGTDNPADAVWKTGYDSPTDTVFTASKAFAVQLGAAGLKEIT